MIPQPPAVKPLILVADEDAATLELLVHALAAERFRVVTAADGDEAIRRMIGERPAVAVLGTRLPRRNGFEVCDWLRHDPDDPHVPVVLTGAGIDSDLRIEGLARGADEFLVKPFPTRELVARVHRLLARASALRAQRGRVVALERELERAQDDLRRAQGDLARERRLRETAFAAAREWPALLDAAAIARRALAQAALVLGADALALIVPAVPVAGTCARDEARAAHGSGAARFAGLALEAGSEVATALAGLGRPALLHDLERWPSLRGALAPFTAAGVALVAPLRGAEGLEALLLAGERADGRAWAPEDREVLGALCDFTGSALLAARRWAEAQDRLLETTAASANETTRAALAAAEAGTLADRAAEALELPARERALARHAAVLGPWAWGEEGRATLASLERLDPSGRVAAVRALVACGESLEVERLGSVALRRAAAIAAVCARGQVGRRSGRSATESLGTALAWAGAALDPATAAALAGAAEPRALGAA